MPNARDITVSIQRPEMRELARKALAQGFRPGGVRKHGLWLLAPNGEDTVSVSHTSGDRRAYANMLAELKRFGFKEEEPSQNGVVRAPNTDPEALQIVEVLVGQNRPMTAQELSAMAGVAWNGQVADMIRHMADAGQIDRYGKVTLAGTKLPYRANVYVPRGYTQPVSSEPIATVPRVEPEPKPEPPPLPPAAVAPRVGGGGIARVVDALIALGRPAHIFEIAEYMGVSALTIGPTLSGLSRSERPHPFRPLGNVKKRDKVQRPGHTKPIVRYEWVPLTDQPRTEPQPPPEPPQPSPAPAPDEEVPVAAKPAANETAIEVVRDVAPTTLLGLPLQFWEDVLRGVAYGLSRTREREGGVG